MPRVQNLGDNVDEACKRLGIANSIIDVCRECNEELEDDPHCHDDVLVPYNGDPQGDYGWGEPTDHPLYDEQYPKYTCAICDKKLADEEDY